VIAMLEGLGADAVGMNCSLGPAMLAPVAEEYLRLASVPVILKPNAGLPRIVEKKTVYDVLPDTFAEEVAVLLHKGVRITGGCCGTAPEYIAAVVRAADGITVKEVSDKDTTCIASHTHGIVLGDETVWIGDRTHALCNPECRAYLQDGDIDSVVSDGCDEQDEEVHMLALNVSVPDGDEAESLAEAVFEMQTLVNLPLFLDTSDGTALEAALRCYKGKAMVGTVYAVRESMDVFFPIVRKYGAAVVCLTADENGVPVKAADRAALAGQMLAEAEKYGIARKDIVFAAAPLTGGESDAAETVEAVRQITTLGCRTILNVSGTVYTGDGVPMNGDAFAAMAAEAGVSCVLGDPYSGIFENFR